MTRKRIIIVVLAIILLLTGFTQNTIEISAAQKEVGQIETRHDTMETGKQFYIGDMVRVSFKNNQGSEYAYFLDASYVSDRPEVVEVREDGFAETKAPGEAIVTVSCQGVSAEYSVTVVEKGTLSAGREQIVEEWEQAGRTLAQKIPSGSELTVESGYALLKAVQKYLYAFDNCADIEEAVFNVAGLEYWTNDQWLAPAASCFTRAKSMMSDYIVKYHPMYQKKYWVSKKNEYQLSATPDGITLKFKKKLSSQAILALYMEEALYAIENDEANFPLRINLKIKKDRLEARTYLSDKKSKRDERDFEGTAVFVKGSKKVTIKPTAVPRYINGKRKFVKKKNLKLKKGATYELTCGTLQLGVYSHQEIRVK